ncbi:hypothetical protein NMW39_22200 [Escherichia coli]|uniref:hypothetical protein n=1 Tax=Escherichia coli TaxID=562 RepID=UPI0012BE0949|nr:hypothetical protein [Escherichia coli]EAN6540590.1 hypothetical protein [Salmonella enterica]EDX6306894.1 hypothetical protein [Salmonella enterica subsp. enterica serovar Java]EAT0220332.1 hypothetical protein [Salmonella enterica]EAT6264562.1 hypothetical protein [Salmonella enterica]EEV1955490.1 hypothetical protein [Escherichia coli]
MAANTGMLTIDFKSFAESIKITEGELAYLLEHEQVYKGIPLPNPISVGWNKKRKFHFKDVSAFLEQLNKAK